MKILSMNRKEHKVRVMAETPEDLWHLDHVIEEGDLVTSRTMRKVSVKKGGKYEYGDKRPMLLTVRVEKIEFREDSGLLRLTGPIVSGPEDVQMQSYHSIQVEVSSVITIQKKGWKEHEIKRLEKAKIRRPLVLICVLDREGADFAVLRESGIGMKANITNHNREDMTDYYRRIIDYVRKQEFGTLVLAGPGFERENLMRFMEANEKEIAKKTILEHSSSTGTNGIHEVVKKSVNRILKESRIAKESGYVSEILGRIKSEGLVVYGPAETGKAVKIGAVEKLFVSQEKVRDFEGLMEEQEKMRGSIVIIGSDHELGEQFLHLGGIAGFLRFRLDF